MGKKVKLIIIVATILTVAAFLRFFNLNALPVFADESIYVRWSQVMRSESTLRFLPLSDGKQPLFMWLVIPALKIFSDPLIAGRIVSGLAGLGTVVSLGVAAFLLFKNFRLSLIAAALWAVLPYSVFFDRLALADSLLTFFILTGFNLSLLTARYLRLDFALLAGFAYGFAWLTKSPAIFAILLTPTLAVFISHKTKRNLIKYLFLVLVSWILAYGMYNILRLGSEFHMIAIRNQDYLYPLSEVLSHPDQPLIPHLGNVAEYLWYLLTPIGCLLLVWGLFDRSTQHVKERLIVGAWLLVPVIAESAFAIALTARYLLFAIPFAAIFIAHAIEHIGQRTQRHFLTILTFVLVFINSFWFSLLFSISPLHAYLPPGERSGYLEDWTAGTGLRDIAIEIRQHAQSGAAIIVGAEGFFGTPFSAMQMYLNGLPNVRIVGVGLEESTVPQSLTNSLSDNQVYWVLNSNRFKITEPEKLGLKLLKAYPKAIKPNLSQDSTLFFLLQKP